MSRIGKQPIILTAGVTATLHDSQVTIKGPKGELSLQTHPDVMCTVSDGVIAVSVKHPDEKNDRALWGLSQRLIANMVKGVTEGFQKKLEVNGVGYKVSVVGSTLTLALGFSHPVLFEAPAGISLQTEKNTITISGIDKQRVGETAARIRALKKPEPYKGKGIKYADEVVRRKAGKAGKAGGKK